MAIEGYILVKGGAAGDHEGTSKKAGHPKGSSILHSFNQTVETPFDAGHGTTSARRLYKQIICEIVPDASIYQYYKDLILKDKDGAKKSTVEFGFFRANQDNIGVWGGGETAPWLKINLTDAFVTSVSFIMGETREATAGSARNEYVRVGFVFKGILWTYMNGGKSQDDDWTK